MMASNDPTASASDVLEVVETAGQIAPAQQTKGTAKPPAPPTKTTNGSKPAPVKTTAAASVKAVLEKTLTSTTKTG